MPRTKNIIILSEKSSGSSACQDVLTRFAKLRHVSSTRHFESETLYWTKAASVLCRPQLRMVDSEVPIERNSARSDLTALLTANLDEYVPPSDDSQLIFQGWDLLCHKHAPIFLEKSPHHLCQWSALELIIEYMEWTNEVDVLLIGLIRNPIDTIYSQYRRFGSSPAAIEQQWQVAYGNLLHLKALMKEKVVIIRYEDLVSSVESLTPVLEFCGLSLEEAAKNHFHRKSLQKWRDNPFFGFCLARSTIELAVRYGYREDEMVNKSRAFWPTAQLVSQIAHSLVRRARGFIRKE